MQILLCVADYPLCAMEPSSSYPVNIIISQYYGGDDSLLFVCIEYCSWDIHAVS